MTKSPDTGTLKTWNVRLQLGCYVASFPIKHYTAQQAHALAMKHLSLIAAVESDDDATRV